MDVSTAITVVFVSAISTPPLLCVGIASIKNRDITKWAIYGLFFGIYAVIYILFYTEEGDGDRIKPKVLVLLVVLWGLFLIAIYETFFGLLIDIV